MNLLLIYSLSDDEYSLLIYSLSDEFVINILVKWWICY